MIGMAKSGIIGEIKDVEACFTKLVNDNTRELIDIEYGGSFTELASYTLLPIIKLLGTNYKGIRFCYNNISNGLDGYTKVYFDYENAFATSKTGLKVKSEGELVISGTLGYIKVAAPWWKTTEFEVCYEDISQNEKVYTQFKGDGLRYEISDFVSIVNGYGDNIFKLACEESISIAELMEYFLKEHRGIGFMNG